MRSRNVRNPGHIPYASKRGEAQSPDALRAAQIARVEACRAAAIARLTEFDALAARAPHAADEIYGHRVSYVRALDGWELNRPYVRVPNWSVACQSALWLAELAARS